MCGVQRSLITTVFGGLSLPGGLTLVSLVGQSLSLHYLVHHISQIQDGSFLTFAMVLIMLAALTKSI